MSALHSLFFPFHLCAPVDSTTPLFSARGDIGQGKRVETYQFFAIMSLPSGFESFLRCCDCFTGCLDDRFFFFWRSRPIVSYVLKVSGSKKVWFVVCWALLWLLGEVAIFFLERLRRWEGKCWQKKTAVWILGFGGGGEHMRTAQAGEFYKFRPQTPRVTANVLNYRIYHGTRDYLRPRLHAQASSVAHDISPASLTTPGVGRC